MTRPALLFADEPTGNLDYTTGTEILDALWRSCVERHQTVVLVTHDSKAAAYADRVLVISDGRIRDEIAPRPARGPRRRRRSSAASPSSGSVARWAALTSLAWRSLAAPGAAGRRLSIVGIALGIGVLFASLATDAGIDASIDRTVRDLVGRADLRVEAFGDRACRPTASPRSSAAPGVVVAAPALERRTYLVTDRRRPERRCRRRSRSSASIPALEARVRRPAARRPAARCPDPMRKRRS